MWENLVINIKLALVFVFLMENVDHFSLYFGVLCAPPLSPSPHAHTTPTRRRLCLSTVSDSPCLGDAEVVQNGNRRSGPNDASYALCDLRKTQFVSLSFLLLKRRGLIRWAFCFFQTESQKSNELHIYRRYLPAFLKDFFKTVLCSQQH